jgi:hypothetical protein
VRDCFGLQVPALASSFLPIAVDCRCPVYSTGRWSFIPTRPQGTGKLCCDSSARFSIRACPDQYTIVVAVTFEERTCCASAP